MKKDRQPGPAVRIGRPRGGAAAAAVLLLAIAGSLVGGCATPLGDACTSDEVCGGGLVCARPPIDAGVDPPGVCAEPPAAAGERCRSADDCAPGLLCTNELPASTRRQVGTCAAPGLVGAPCATDHHCAAPLVCGPDGRCAAEAA